MRKAIVASLTVAALALPASAPAQPASAPAQDVVKAPEFCVAFNPGQTTCHFEVTTDDTYGNTGALGPGEWFVLVKRGKKKIKFKSTGSPDGVAFTYKPGDHVYATVTSPGGVVLAGHD